MDAFRDELNAIKAWVDLTLTGVVQYLPNLIGVLVVFIVGWFLARLLRKLVMTLTQKANQKLDSHFNRGSLNSSRASESAANILAKVVFWLVLFITAVIAARLSGLVNVSTWLDQIVAQLPKFLIGIAIVVGGYVVGTFVRDEVTDAARAAHSRQSHFLGKLAQTAIFASALIIGLGQIGIDVTFLVALFAVATGAIFVGFSIAFGLGAKDFISDLVGSRDVGRDLKPGLTVRIGDTEGVVLEVTPTRIALDTADGRTLIPARQASAETIVILTEENYKEALDE